MGTGQDGSGQLGGLGGCLRAFLATIHSKKPLRKRGALGMGSASVQRFRPCDRRGADGLWLVI